MFKVQVCLSDLKKIHFWFVRKSISFFYFGLILKNESLREAIIKCRSKCINLSTCSTGFKQTSSICFCHLFYFHFLAFHKIKHSNICSSLTTLVSRKISTSKHTLSKLMDPKPKRSAALALTLHYSIDFKLIDAFQSELACSFVQQVHSLFISLHKDAKNLFIEKKTLYMFFIEKFLDIFSFRNKQLYYISIKLYQSELNSIQLSIEKCHFPAFWNPKLLQVGQHLDIGRARVLPSLPIFFKKP